MLIWEGKEPEYAPPTLGPAVGYVFIALMALGVWLIARMW